MSGPSLLHFLDPLSAGLVISSLDQTSLMALAGVDHLSYQTVRSYVQGAKFCRAQVLDLTKQRVASTTNTIGSCALSTAVQASASAGNTPRCNPYHSILQMFRTKVRPSLPLGSTNPDSLTQGRKKAVQATAPPEQAEVSIQTCSSCTYSRLSTKECFRRSVESTVTGQMDPWVAMTAGDDTVAGCMPLLQRHLLRQHGQSHAALGSFIAALKGPGCPTRLKVLGFTAASSVPSYVVEGTSLATPGYDTMDCSCPGCLRRRTAAAGSRLQLTWDEWEQLLLALPSPEPTGQEDETGTASIITNDKLRLRLHASTLPRMPGHDLLPDHPMLLLHVHALLAALQLAWALQPHMQVEVVPVKHGRDRREFVLAVPDSPAHIALYAMPNIVAMPLFLPSSHVTPLIRAAATDSTCSRLSRMQAGPGIAVPPIPPPAPPAAAAVPTLPSGMQGVRGAQSDDEGRAVEPLLQLAEVQHNVTAGQERVSGQARVMLATAAGFTLTGISTSGAAPRTGPAIASASILGEPMQFHAQPQGQGQMQGQWQGNTSGHIPPAQATPTTGSSHASTHLPMLLPPFPPHTLSHDYSCPASLLSVPSPCLLLPSSLRELSVSGYVADDAGLLDALGSLASLERLHLVGLILGAKGLSRLCNLRRLKHLAVDVITTARPLENTSLPVLESLFIADALTIRQPLVQLFPVLRVLSIGDVRAGVEPLDHGKRESKRTQSRALRAQCLRLGFLSGHPHLYELHLWDIVESADHLARLPALRHLVLHNLAGGRWARRLLPLTSPAAHTFTITLADCGSTVCHAAASCAHPATCCAFPEALLNVSHLRLQACRPGVLVQLLHAAAAGWLEHVHELTFVCCACLSDRALLQLCVALGGALQQLVVEGCGGVTATGMQRLSREAGVVETLSVTFLP